MLIFEGCLFLWGANKCMYYSGSAQLQLCGSGLALYILGLEVHFCPLFTAFLQPEIQSAINRLLPTPIHQCKALGTNKFVRVCC